VTEYIVKIIALRYTPPRMVTVNFDIDEIEMSSAIVMPLESVTIEEVASRLQHEIPRKLADPGHDAFIEAAKSLVGRELKILVKDKEGTQ